MSEKLYKDVIMIIKGWYNKEKYNCSFAALNAYYHKHYTSVSDLTYDTAIENFLIPTMNWVFENKYESCEVYFKLITDRLYRTRKANTSYLAVLFDGMVIFLFSLAIRNIDEITKKPYWIIDMSEYKEDVI